MVAIEYFYSPILLSRSDSLAEEFRENKLVKPEKDFKKENIASHIYLSVLISEQQSK